MKNLLVRILNSFIFILFAVINIIAFPFAAFEYIVSNNRYIWNAIHKANEECYIGGPNKEEVI